MAVLPIITAPDQRLKIKSAAVEAVDDGVRALIGDLLETMYDAPGIGLAAIQVGVARRVLVIDAAGAEEKRAPVCLVNPELVWASGETWTYEEGCLSLPEQYAEVSRPRRIRVRHLDQGGKESELEAENLLATCIQHEMDHLEGILFVDHLSQLKRRMILRKLAKAQKQEAVGA